MLERSAEIDASECSGVPCVVLSKKGDCHRDVRIRNGLSRASSRSRSIKYRSTNFIWPSLRYLLLALAILRRFLSSSGILEGNVRQLDTQVGLASETATIARNFAPIWLVRVREIRTGR